MWAVPSSNPRAFTIRRPKPRREVRTGEPVVSSYPLAERARRLALRLFDELGYPSAVAIGETASISSENLA
jgi:hypothetical protein